MATHSGPPLFLPAAALAREWCGSRKTGTGGGARRRRERARGVTGCSGAQRNAWHDGSERTSRSAPMTGLCATAEWVPIPTRLTEATASGDGLPEAGPRRLRQ